MDDLIAIGRYIAQDNRVAARRWVARLKERANEAAKMPHSGRQVAELVRNDVREVVEGNYRIVYRTDAKVFEVLTVFEGHRSIRLDASEIPGPTPKPI